MRLHFAVLVAIGLASTSVQAQVPQVMSYQGRLTRPDGSAYVGAQTLRFSVFAALSGGTALWTETHTVVLTNGLYSVLLGSPSGGIPVTLFNGADRYIEVEANGSVLSPRQRIGSVAHAFTAGNGTPSGSVVAFSGDAAPTGWLLCNGAAVSRTTYAALFAVVGTKFGPGDGATTFNLPDMSRRFPLGKSASDTVGAAGGSFDHTHGLPRHQHDVDAPLTVTDRGSGFDRNDCNNNGGILCDNHQHTVDVLPFPSATERYLDGGTNGISTSANPPYVVFNYLIKI